MRQKKRQFGVRIEIGMQCYLIITQTKYYPTFPYIIKNESWIQHLIGELSDSPHQDTNQTVT